MAQCEYTRYDQKRCEESALAGQSLCILHDKAPAKDAAEFLKALKDKVDKEEQDSAATDINLAGVVFPPGFRWADVVSNDKALGKSANFSDATFTGDAYFTGTTFSGAAHFRDATFTGDADFVGAKFAAAAGFGGTTFNGAAHFWVATFSGAANFVDAKFSGDADFVGATFSGDADFWVAKFSGDADFEDATFAQNESVGFAGATFRERLRFRGTTFPRDEGQGVVSCTSVTLKKPECVYFQDVNLSRVSFLGTDIRQAHFLNATWAKLPRRPRPLPQGWPFATVGPLWRRWPKWLRTRALNVVYDDPDVRGVERPARGDYDEAAELYRQLRVNLEENRQHIEAGDFYVGQMDMRLHDSSLGGLHRGLLWLYGVATLYGESFLRPLALYGITALLLGLGYLWTGFQWSPRTVHRPDFAIAAVADSAFWKDFGEAVVLALRAGPIPVSEPAPVSRWLLPLRYLNALLNVLWLAVVVIALRRQFRR